MPCIISDMLPSAIDRLAARLGVHLHFQQRAHVNSSRRGLGAHYAAVIAERNLGLDAAPAKAMAGSTVVE